MNWLPFLRKRHAWDAELDAYLDGELTAADVARFEGHLAACDSCRVAIDATRAIRQAFAALPELEAPRSFRLTDAMVSAPAPAPPPPAQPRWYPRAAAGVMATAVAAFAVLVVVDSTGTESNGGMQATGEFSADGAAEESAAGASEMVDPEGDTAPADDATDGEARAGDATDGEARAGDTDTLDGGAEASALAAEQSDDGGLDGMRAAQVAAGIIAIGALGAFAYTARRNAE